jgi:uncharacterized repeat protein (TIGR02543 family)
MLRRVLIFMAALAAFAALTAPSFAAKGGSGDTSSNAPNAKSCQKDGWKLLARSASSTTAFVSESECTGYAAKKGNTIVVLQRALTVTKSGAGSGTVTSNPTGVNCGTDCSELFNHGTSVTFTAAPATGSTFSGWSGSCTGTTTCTVTMDQARTVTATFTAAAQYRSLSQNCDLTDPRVAYYPDGTRYEGWEVCTFRVHDEYLRDQWGDPLQDDETGEWLLNTAGIAANDAFVTTTTTGLSPSCDTFIEEPTYEVFCPLGS